MDEIDARIINLLRENARHVGLTERAVRARIEKLLRDGVIRKFTVETKPVGVEGIVLVNTQVDKTQAIKDKARQMSDMVFECSGDYDVAVRLRADNLDELNQRVDEIRKMPGVNRTSTLIKLD